MAGWKPVQESGPLHAVASLWLHYMYSTFAHIPAFSGVPSPTVCRGAITVILAVASCWCYSCSLRHCYCLLPYCSWHSCCCWRPFSSCIMFFTVTGFPAISGVPGIVSDLAVAVSCVSGVPSVAGFPAVSGVLAVASVADSGVLIVAGLIIYCTVLYNGTH